MENNCNVSVRCCDVFAAIVEFLASDKDSISALTSLISVAAIFSNSDIKARSCPYNTSLLDSPYKILHKIYITYVLCKPHMCRDRFLDMQKIEA